MSRGTVALTAAPRGLQASLKAQVGKAVKLSASFCTAATGVQFEQDKHVTAKLTA